MIQFMRGSAATFEERNPILAAGQPGYEKDTGKLKIGDGTSPWMSLNYVAVGDLESIVDPEYSPTSARAQSGQAVHQAISEIVSTVDDPATAPIISIGSNPPDSSVNSVVYLQEIEPQTDYIVQNGTSGIWTWEKWNSGKAVCWGIFDVYYQDVNKLTTTVDFPFEIIGDIYAQVTKIAGAGAYNTLYATTCYEATSTQIIIALCNSGERFGESDTLKLSVYVIGKWK